MLAGSPRLAPSAQKWDTISALQHQERACFTFPILELAEGLSLVAAANSAPNPQVDVLVHESDSTVSE